jgi:putative membrane protein
MAWLVRNASLVFYILHAVGFFGFMFMPNLFIWLTPIHLLTISYLLIRKGYAALSNKVLITIALLFAGGMLIEILGVQTGAIFGGYKYGEVLGPKLMGVPYVIGLNWMTLIISVYAILIRRGLPKWTIPILCSVVIVGFDFLLEPTAIRFGWWTWDNIQVPMQNYIAWGVTVALYSSLMVWAKVPALAENEARHFMASQILFFIAIQNFV